MMQREKDLARDQPAEDLPPQARAVARNLPHPRMMAPGGEDPLPSGRFLLLAAEMEEMATMMNMRKTLQ